MICLWSCRAVDEVPIYNFTSGKLNPFTWREISNLHLIMCNCACTYTLKCLNYDESLSAVARCNRIELEWKHFKNRNQFFINPRNLVWCSILLNLAFEFFKIYHSEVRKVQTRFVGSLKLWRKMLYAFSLKLWELWWALNVSNCFRLQRSTLQVSSENIQ